MNRPWFSRRAIFFIPRSIAGWVILLAAAATAVCFFIDIDGRSHSASDTLINFFFILLIIAAVYSIAGFIGSGHEKNGEGGDID